MLPTNRLTDKYTVSLDNGEYGNVSISPRVILGKLGSYKININGVKVYDSLLE
jgi:hypothetical protein